MKKYTRSKSGATKQQIQVVRKELDAIYQKYQKKSEQISTRIIYDADFYKAMEVLEKIDKQ